MAPEFENSIVAWMWFSARRIAEFQLRLRRTFF